MTEEDKQKRDQVCSTHGGDKKPTARLHWVNRAMARMHRDSQDRSMFFLQSSEHLRKLTTLGFELKGFRFGARLLLFNEEYKDSLLES
jgi:hypothetical protein